jgi:FkbM family methyltransferase
VEPKELWLDLGANIGAFALYCKARQARAVCFEPGVDNFKLLTQNAEGMSTYRAAVTARNSPTITMYNFKRRSSYLQASEFSSYWRAVGEPRQRIPQEDVPNVCALDLVGKSFDGVKIDIEGSEGPILDARWLPKCRKLVLEYHTSIDTSVDNLRRRLDFLRQSFNYVVYPKEYDRVIESGVEQFKPYFDRQIFAWN